MLHRLPISHSQLAELLGIEPSSFVAIDRNHRWNDGMWELVTEVADMNTSGTVPQLNTGKKTGGKKPGGRRGC